MNHHDAIRESSSVKYALGELTGATRDSFEEHLFECPLCAEELKSTVTFLEVSRDQLRLLPQQEHAQPSTLASRPARRFAWLLSPAWLVPALAASLACTAYQTTALATRTATPAIVNTVALATGASRGSVKAIQAPRHGSFLVSFDIPARPEFTAYRCSLYSPANARVWQGTVSPEQARDSITLAVPAAATQAGINYLLVEGLSPETNSGGNFVELSRYEFLLQLEK